MPKLLSGSATTLHTYTVLYRLSIPTQYNTILRIPRNFLETRESIKISTHPFYHINLDWFSWEWSKKKIFFLKFYFSKWPPKISLFFKIANSWNFFAENNWELVILKNSVLLSWPFWLFFKERCFLLPFSWKSVQIYMV